jgi:hypothetical protein
VLVSRICVSLYLEPPGAGYYNRKEVTITLDHRTDTQRIQTRACIPSRATVRIIPLPEAPPTALAGAAPITVSARARTSSVPSRSFPQPASEGTPSVRRRLPAASTGFPPRGVRGDLARSLRMVLAENLATHLDGTLACSRATRGLRAAPGIFYYPETTLVYAHACAPEIRPRAQVEFIDPGFSGE